MENTQLQGVSIVVPAYNEEGNIEELVRRIDMVFDLSGIKYEIIFIDDHSTDNTFNKVCDLYPFYPINIYRKKGKKGKSYSILEGMEYAAYDKIAMIDADLQYPPEALPKMVKMLNDGYDIVVADREEREESLIRQITSKSFCFIFCKALHGLSCDVQSGLKIFRKDIINRITIHPTPWTFDMEFLLNARSAGYKIGSHEIKFSKRNAGKSKINVFKSSLEIGLNALALKFREEGPIPLDPLSRSTSGNGIHYKGKKYMTYMSLHHTQSALLNFTMTQKIIIVDIALALFASLLLNWHSTIIAVVGILSLVYLLDMFFSIYIMRLGIKNLTAKRAPDIAAFTPDLPLYTVLCPLYKEWQVIPQFIDAMQKLEYPKEKLQVLLLLEEKDRKTIEEVQKFELPKYFQTIIVPESQPKTKPKACNYGLAYAKGQYTVIYDAEDIPEPKQLLKAVGAFAKAPENVVCLQAKLNYFNPRQNILTRFFTAEYSLWFDLILPGLQELNAPIPLGGTSNHFITDALKKIGGWDVFNVTEDCDLGIRLFKNHFTTQIIHSTTLEEANSRVFNWINQRSRWIKGYMQTYFVQMRDPVVTAKQMGLYGFIIFQLTVGGKIFTVLLNPLLWVITLTYFVFRPLYGPLIESFFPPQIYYFGVISFLIGNFLYLYSYTLASAARKYYDIEKYTLLIPLYWALMSIASWKSVYSLIVSPHYWAKTVHGFHMQKAAQTLTKKSSLLTPLKVFQNQPSYFDAKRYPRITYRHIYR